MFFGGPGLNKNLLYTVFLILFIYSLSTMTKLQWLMLILTLPAVIIAITFHEFAHAYVATKLGDTTPRNQGRLTLNPISHLDWFGFFLMMFAHIGWGKPVQINPNNFNTNKSKGFCEIMVSAAGPLMNFLIAVIGCIALVAMTYFVKFDNSMLKMTGLFLDFLIKVNIGLGVFNLIPLPPLDGEKIFRNMLPYKAQAWLQENYYTLYTIFMFLWIFNFLEPIVAVPIEIISQGLLYGVEKCFAFVIRLFM